MVESTVTAGQPASEAQGTRQYVWQLPVRIVHWAIVLSIVVLSFTGYYIHNPFIKASPSSASFLMGQMRFAHMIAAFVFSIAVLVRIYWAFSGNRYAHWKALIPHRRDQFQNLAQALGYYLFLRRKPPEEGGHNQLAALAYMLLYLFFIFQIITGFALFAWLTGLQPWTTMFSWAYRLLPVQELRLIHFLLMFVFFMFTIWHLYASILVDATGRAGIVSSIFTGFKWLRRRHHDDTEGQRAG